MTRKSTIFALFIVIFCMWPTPAQLRPFTVAPQPWNADELGNVRAVVRVTNRMPWSDNADPRPIWKVWDDFGMQGTEMFGYWSPNCPVKTNDPKVLATVYKKGGAALVAIASWAEGDTEVQLDINWSSLGIDPAKATITAPEVIGFQAGKSYGVGDKIAVAKNKGLLLVVK